MVHPRVIANCGLDPDEWQGFAFGVRHRPAGDAQIRHGRSARLLRRRFALAQTLRLPRARRADPLRGRRRMKFTLSWLKEHLETEASLDEIVETLTRIGLEVEGVENRGRAARALRRRRGADRRAAPAGRQAPGADRRCRHRRGDPGGLRRAQCAGRPQGRVRRAGRLCAGQRPDAEGRGDPRRREPRHDVLGARAGARRGA